MDENLKKNVMNFVQFQWYFNSDIEYKNLKKIFADCSDELKEQILDSRIMKAIETIPIFQDVDRHFLKCVASKACLRLLPEQSYIVNYGQMAQNIHTIIRGCVQVNIYFLYITIFIHEL